MFDVDKGVKLKELYIEDYKMFKDFKISLDKWKIYYDRKYDC